MGKGRQIRRCAGGVNPSQSDAAPPKTSYQAQPHPQRAAGDRLRRVERPGKVSERFMGDGRDTAHASLFLASDEARFITATEIVVDGGMSARCDYDVHRCASGSAPNPRPSRGATTAASRAPSSWMARAMDSITVRCSRQRLAARAPSRRRRAEARYLDGAAHATVVDLLRQSKTDWGDRDV